MTERELCYEILYKIHINGELSHIALKNVLDDCDSKKLDINKSFVSSLVNGVNERYLTLLYLISKQAGRPVGKIKPAVRIMLAMGVYQAYYMSVPESAACNETVKLAVKRGFSGLKGFVNGVLRGMLRNIKDVDEFLDKELENEGKIKKFSIKYSCPEWLVEHYCKECGEEAAEKILASCFEIKPLTVYGMTSVVSEEELPACFERDNIKVSKIEGVNSAYAILTPCNIASLEAYKKGYIIVQDISSMLATELLPEVKDAEILDVCAAPGGKTAHCADRFIYAGCRVTARDLTVEKVGKIKETLKRTGLNNVVTEVKDALVHYPDDVGKYDIVVADLPCSGLGVIGRKADIKYKTRPEDVKELAGIQKQILGMVSSYVKTGGYLAYSTCTVAKQENDENSQYIISRGFEPVSIEERLDDGFKQYLVSSNSLQLLPNKEHDGFYISLYKKN